MTRGRRGSAVITTEDGTVARVCGLRGELTEADRAALEEVIEAAAKKVAEGPFSRGVRSCRECGCTDDNACVTDGAPCHWVSLDLCSACAA